MKLLIGGVRKVKDFPEVLYLPTNNWIKVYTSSKGMYVNALVAPKLYKRIYLKEELWWSVNRLMTWIDKN